MKKILFLVFLSFCFCNSRSQEFAKQLTTARTSYSSGNLEEARFAMQQMMQEIDMVVGKEILKLLPAKLDDKAANMQRDEVSGASGFMGTVIHREYGPAEKNIVLEITNNSPLIATYNSILSLAVFANTPESKVIRLSNGYKGVQQRSENTAATSQGTETKVYDYDLQIPINNTLITLRIPAGTEDQVKKLGASLPIAEIAKLVK